MDLNYVVKDEKGVAVNSVNNPQGAIPFQQGETKTFQCFLFNDDGSPFVFPSASEIVLEIFSMIAQASITKKLSLSQVIPIASATLDGDIGFQFSLTSANTGAMAVNNVGLGFSMTWTDESENVSQQDFTGVFSVTAPLVGSTSEGP
jgi:hypothetical protein